MSEAECLLDTEMAVNLSDLKAGTTLFAIRDGQRNGIDEFVVTSIEAIDPESNVALLVLERPDGTSTEASAEEGSDPGGSSSVHLSVEGQRFRVSAVSYPSVLT